MASKSKITKSIAPSKKSSASAITATSTGKERAALPSPELAERLVHDASVATEETLETAGEQIEEMKEAVRQVAEASLDQSRAFYGKLREAADQATLSFDETHAATKKAAENLHMVWLKSINDRTNGAFDLFQSLTSVHSLPDVLEICGDYTRKEIDSLTRSGGELSEAMQAYAREASKPFTESFGKNLTL